MRSALTVAAWLSWPCRIFAFLCGCLLFVLAAVIIYDVIGRRFFATGSFMLQELEWHLHGAIAVLAFGYAYLKDAHVRIDVFSTSFSGRTRLRIEIAAIVLFLIPFMVFVTIYGTEFAWRAFVRGEGSTGGVGLPERWIIKSAVPLSAVLAMLGGVAVALRAYVALKRPDLLADPFERDASEGFVETGPHADRPATPERRP
ncbi:TRAP transporter small permease subunit [Acuticoccus mangrovi]|uniref:TRAP transporter small permease protein n=1 Tax=Acuticoccus mangrovi TaxID=2796142 RepID=A0A934IM23_9HYPH|nr:TRAP transporter small permease subunit [Acuticoccus mangrovi]MBJ3777421.1 TRAP transporter small permease subunit [Acuticoccus mangrovi]